MFPYDQSEIGRRRAKAAIESVAEFGRLLGLKFERQLAQARPQAGLPVEPDDESPRDPPTAA